MVGKKKISWGFGNVNYPGIQVLVTGEEWGFTLLCQLQDIHGIRAGLDLPREAMEGADFGWDLEELCTLSHH